MTGNRNIPGWCLSRSFRRRFLQVRHCTLILFQAGGLFITVTVAVFLFGDPSGHSKDEIGPAAPLIGKLCIIAFVLAWNAMVFLMLRQSSRTLRDMRKNENSVQAAPPGHGKPPA